MNAGIPEESRLASVEHVQMIPRGCFDEQVG